MADLVWSDPDPEKEDFAISPRYVVKDSFSFCWLRRVQRSGVYLRRGSGPQIPAAESNVAYSARPPTLHGGLFITV
jgi:hypothetical protein